MNTYKCIVVGDGGAGKTTYCNMLLGQDFQPRYVATMGVDVCPVRYEKSCFNMWDTSGQEKFGGLREDYYVAADCAMICFDVSSKLTFRSVPKWYESVSEYTQCIVLVGFKSDVDAKVSDDDIAKLCIKYGLSYFKISSKNADGIFAPLEYFESRLG